jgi:hypothetical protein
MDKDWQQVINEDHALSRIIKAITEGPLGSLTKAELVEKAYFDEWKQERLVVKDRIVYWYKVCSRVSIRQLHTQSGLINTMPHSHCGLPYIPCRTPWSPLDDLPSHNSVLVDIHCKRHHQGGLGVCHIMTSGAPQFSRGPDAPVCLDL